MAKAKSVKEQHPGEHRYLTHDNGGRPYLVYTGETDVTVYTAPPGDYPYGWPDDKDDYTKLVKKITNVSKKFIPRYKTVRDFNSTGNSILVQSGKEYVYIGENIFKFKPEKGDEILKYFSPIGNSDVPYPVAVGKTHVYIILDKVVIEKEIFPKGVDWENGAMDYYYENLSSDRRNLKTFSGYKELAPRLAG
jgi:hypothetical protein